MSLFSAYDCTGHYRVMIFWYSILGDFEFIESVWLVSQARPPVAANTVAVNEVRFLSSDFVDFLFWKDLLWNWSGLEWDLRELYQYGRCWTFYAPKCWWSSHSCKYWSLLWKYIFRLSLLGNSRSFCLIKPQRNQKIKNRETD